MIETLREKLIRCGWITPFNADTLVKLINKHCADVIRDAADQVVPIDYVDIQGCWYEKKNSVREQFLAIADELEAQP